MSPFQSILKLKKTIEEAFDVPCGKQILKYKGNILNENQTIKSVGVGPDDNVIFTIILEKQIDFQED